MLHHPASVTSGNTGHQPDETNKIGFFGPFLIYSMCKAQLDIYISTVIQIFYTYGICVVCQRF